MPRRLPLVCPSNASGASEFYTSPCTGKACSWWNQRENICNAIDTLDDYARWEKPTAVLPDCPIASSCMWDVQEVAKGRRGCVPRRLGLLCEHQAGKPGVDPDLAVWNTFNMAEPDDAEAWG